MAKANVGDEEHRAAEQLAWIGLMDQALADCGSDGYATGGKPEP
jgi:HemY protein